jgi:hypothetical protein
MVLENRGRLTAALVAVVSLVILLAACGGPKGSHAAAEQSAKGDLHAVASSSAVASDEAAAEKNIIQPCLTAANVTSVTKVKSCVEAKVPPADRAQLKSCLAKAAANDKVWTKAGRLQFEKVGIQQCAAAAIPDASPSVTVSPTTTVSPGVKASK